MTAKNDITGDLIKSKPSDTYASNYDQIFRKDKQTTTEHNETKQVGGGESSKPFGN